MSFRFALALALAVTSGHTIAQSAESTQEKPQDPVMMALMGCHFEYVKANYSSKATPTEIATAAMAMCQRQFHAAGKDTFNKAIASGLPLQNAEGAKEQVLDALRNYLPGFTIDKVIQFRNIGTKQ